MSWVSVARQGEVSDGEIRAIVVDGLELVLCRWGEHYAALERRCLHAGADLADGALVDGEVVCPLHGWCYRASTGVHVQSPGNRLASHRVRLHEGMVQVWPTRRAADEPRRQAPDHPE